MGLSLPLIIIYINYQRFIIHLAKRATMLILIWYWIKLHRIYVFNSLVKHGVKELNCYPLYPCDLIL